MLPFQLVHTVEIKNGRLRTFSAVLNFLVLAGCAWELVHFKKYTKSMVNNTNVVLSLPQEDDHSWLKNRTSNTSWHGKSLHIRGTPSHVTVSTRCPRRPAYTPTSTTCHYSSEVAIKTRHDEATLSLGKFSTSFGYRVKSPSFQFRLAEQYSVFPFHVTYVTHLTSTVPSFIGGLNGELRRGCSQLTASTVMLDRDGHIARIFEPGPQIDLSAAEILWAAKPVGGVQWMAEQLQQHRYVNVSGPLFGTPSDFPDWVWFSGAEVGGSIQCFNDWIDVQEIIPSRLGLRIHSKKPVCILRFTLYRPIMAADTHFRKEPGLHHVNYTINLSVKITGSSGTFRAFEYSYILLQVVSMIVLLKIPTAIMRFITLNLLGHLSVIYRRSVVHDLDIREQCGSAAAKLLQSSSSFQQISDIQRRSGSENPGISQDTLHERLSAALLNQKDLADAEVAAFSKFCSECISKMHICGQALPDNGICQAAYEEACLLNEDIDLIGIFKLFDADRRRLPLESFFTPIWLQKVMLALKSHNSMLTTTDAPTEQSRNHQDRLDPLENASPSWQDSCGSEPQSEEKGMLGPQSDVSRYVEKIGRMEDRLGQLEFAVHKLITQRSETNEESNGQHGTSNSTAGQESDALNHGFYFFPSTSCQQALVHHQCMKANHTQSMFQCKLLWLEMAVHDLKQRLWKVEVDAHHPLRKAGMAASSGASCELQHPGVVKQKKQVAEFDQKALLRGNTNHIGACQTQLRLDFFEAFERETTAKQSSTESFSSSECSEFARFWKEELAG